MDSSKSIRIDRHPSGRGYRLESSLCLPQPRERIFEFFSDAYQLQNITPPSLKFRVTTPGPIHIGEGTVIDYRLRLFGMPLRWQSLISGWEPPHRFVDEQLRGPYRRWRHEHLFETTAQGTLVRDIVQYEVPGGWLIHWLLVRRDLQRIFEFRVQKLRELFG